MKKFKSGKADRGDAHCGPAALSKSFILLIGKSLALPALSILFLAAVFVPQAQAYSGVPAYSAQEIKNADQEWGIIPQALQDGDLSAQITRGEFCQVALLAYRQLDDCEPSEEEESYFSDTDSAYVKSAYLLGIVSGYPDGTFREDSLITRQEIFTMIYNFLTLEDEDAKVRRTEAKEILAAFADAGDLYDWSVKPTAAVVKRGIVKGTASSRLDPYSYTTSAQAIALVYRALSSITDPGGDWDDRSQTDNDGQSWSDGGGSFAGAKDGGDDFDFSKGGFGQAESATPLTDVGYNDQKYILVFGSLDQPLYQSATAAAANMVSVSVKVWQLGANGQKTSASLKLTVNKAIAEVVKAIFQEIYAGAEKFPIKSVGGYSWRGNNTSQHSLGLAIDINPNENYMIKKDGTVTCGSFWDPSASPFSIPEDGDVVRAFHKYGFAWGGNAWNSSHDYMHFSYFGT